MITDNRWNYVAMHDLKMYARHCIIILEDQ